VGEGKATAHPERLPQPADVAALAEEIGARTTTFGGRVTADEDGFDLRIMASAGLAGDWRDFRRIRAWAREISADILARSAATARPGALDTRD
jgi:menaquinone-dependent protoporphyrinogen oxidase